MSSELLSSQVFNTAVGMVPQSKYTQFLKEIKSEMGWSQNNIYNKLKGVTKLNKLESGVARKLLKEYGIDADNQTYINI